MALKCTRKKQSPNVPSYQGFNPWFITNLLNIIKFEWFNLEINNLAAIIIYISYCVFILEKLIKTIYNLDFILKLTLKIRLISYLCLKFSLIKGLFNNKP